MTDDNERASKLHKLIRELNEELKAAQESDLRVEVYVEEMCYMEHRWPRTKIFIVITKAVEII
jgi:hypothetical protein